MHGITALSWASHFHFAEGHALNHYSSRFKIWLAAYTPAHLCRRQYLSLQSSQWAWEALLAAEPSVVHKESLLLIGFYCMCRNFKAWPLHWLLAELILLRASACRAGHCPGAFSPPCSSWVATEEAMAVAKHCNPPSCLGFSETGTAGVHTKYFTVYLWIWKEKPADSHVLPVLKATVWNTHWPPGSISNLPLYLNNSPAP